MLSRGGAPPRWNIKKIFDVRFADSTERIPSIVAVYAGAQVASCPKWDPSPHKDVIRIVCQSDTHMRFEKAYLETDARVPDGDIYIHTGDFSMTGLLSECQLFDHFLTSLPHPHKICIAGNHDLTLDSEFYSSGGGRRFHGKNTQDFNRCRALFTESDRYIYLQDSGVTVCGINFWGSPWQPTFGNWAFNVDRGPLIKQKWDLIPHGTDVLLTHGPAAGHGGLCSNGVDAGCVDLMDAIRRVQPKLHVCGHIHEDYGVTVENGTIFVNASTCTLQYRPLNPPVIIDVLMRDPRQSFA
jgi:hypothetical protein